MSTGPGATLVDRVDYPLFVVTAQADGQAHGCLAGFVTQCSIEPVRFVICISKQNRTFHVAERASTLGLHLLGADQEATASLFGELSGDVVDKMARVDWRPGPGGAPILEECAAWIEGRVLSHQGVGDHEAFVVTVADGGPGMRPVEGQLNRQAASWLRPGHPADQATTMDDAGHQSETGRDATDH